MHLFVKLNGESKGGVLGIFFIMATQGHMTCVLFEEIFWIIDFGHPLNGASKGGFSKLFSLWQHLVKWTCFF